MQNKQHLPLESRESLGNFQAIKTGKKKKRHVCKNIIPTKMPDFQTLVLITGPKTGTVSVPSASPTSFKGAVAPAGSHSIS